jgi:hypothetical protein
MISVEGWAFTSHRFAILLGRKAHDRPSGLLVACDLAETTDPDLDRGIAV